jgi:hypothetical protein
MKEGRVEPLHLFFCGAKYVPNYRSGQRKNGRGRFIEDFFARAARVDEVQHCDKYKHCRQCNQHSIGNPHSTEFDHSPALNRQLRSEEESSENGDESKIDQQIVLDHLCLL